MLRTVDWTVLLFFTAAVHLPLNQDYPCSTLPFEKIVFLILTLKLIPKDIPATAQNMTDEVEYDATLDPALGLRLVCLFFSTPALGHGEVETQRHAHTQRPS